MSEDLITISKKDLEAIMQIRIVERLFILWM